MRVSDNRLINFLFWRLSDARIFCLGILALIKAPYRFWRGAKQKPHNIPGELIISLTSYPPRFYCLANTIKSLLVQTVRPDRVVLWIATQDFKNLPKSVLALQERGLEIFQTEDIGPHKKIIPALLRFPNAYIVTTDDDIHYSPGWLDALIADWDGDNKHIIGHVGSYVALDSNGAIAPYAQWPFSPGKPDDLFFPIGCGGVLYPPGCFHKDVCDQNKFMPLSQGNDDAWLYWMARLQGGHHSKTKNGWNVYNWPKSQKTSLWRKNVKERGTDKVMQNLIQSYGMPHDL